MHHIAPNKPPQDKASPVSAERKPDDPAAKSAPVYGNSESRVPLQPYVKLADAGSDEADRLRKELDVKVRFAYLLCRHN